MIKGINTTRGYNPLNIYAPNIEASKSILMDIKGVIDSNTVTVGDFNTPLTTMNRSSRQKILDQMDLIDIFKVFHPKQHNLHSFQVHIEHSSK